MIPFRDLRRPPQKQQKRKQNPKNAIVGDPFAPIDPSFDFANDFKEFEEEGDEVGEVKDDFFQDSEDNPFGRPRFPGPHHEPNNRAGPPKKALGSEFDGQALEGFGFDGEEFDEQRFEDEDLDSHRFERNQFEGRGFGGKKDKEGTKGKRENLELGKGRKRKEELDVEDKGEEEPLDFRYSTIGLELFKASRGAQIHRKPTYSVPFKQSDSQPTNLPHSG